MAPLSNEFLLQVLMMVFAAGGIYAGIKGDLKAMHERIQAAADAAKAAELTAVGAHRRLDTHLDRRQP